MGNPPPAVPSPNRDIVHLGACAVPRGHRCPLCATPLAIVEELARFGCPRLAQLLELLSLTVPQDRPSNFCVSTHDRV